MSVHTYERMHRFLRESRGSAVGHPCVAPGCDRPATGWGLIGRPTTIDSYGGDLVRFSKHPEDYAPLCSRHNSQRDGGGDWLLCPHGHVRAVWGATAKGYCRGCDRVRKRKPRAATTESPGAPAGDHARQGTDTTERGRS